MAEALLTVVSTAWLLAALWLTLDLAWDWLTEAGGADAAE